MTTQKKSFISNLFSLAGLAWKLLGLAIVIALIFLFFRFRKSLFSIQHRIKTKSTALIVQKKQQIAELATAAYYGEVICSMDSIYQKKTNLNLETEFQKINATYKSIYQSFAAQDSVENLAVEAFKNQYEYKLYDTGPYKILKDHVKGKSHVYFLNFVKDHNWEEFLALAMREKKKEKKQERIRDRLMPYKADFDTIQMVYTKLYNSSGLIDKKRAKLSLKEFKQSDEYRTHIYRLLRNLIRQQDTLRVLSNDDQNFLEVLRTNNWAFETFEKLFKNEVRALKSELKKLESQKIQLAYLARGVVRAGVKLDSLKKEDIKIDLRHDTVFVTITDHFEPQILDTIMNPWFIVPANYKEVVNDPKKEYKGGIKGFEVIQSENVKKLTEEDAQLLKSNCKAYLVDDAMGMVPNVKDQAVESAKKIIDSWISVRYPGKVVEVRISMKKEENEE